MSEFALALEEKLHLLSIRKDELEEEIASIETRMDVLRELLSEEQGQPLSSVAKRKPGRPAGSKKKPASKAAEPSQHAPSDDLLREAQALGGTDPEMAERLKNRFKPSARPQRSYGPGITAGGGKGKPAGERQSNATISDVDENTGDD